LTSPEQEVETSVNNSSRLFLERRGYRRRRIVDGARVLPVLGLLLWFVPLVWPTKGEVGAIGTSAATIYVFVIWTALIAIGAFLASKMGTNDATSADANEGDEPFGASELNDEVEGR